MDAIFTGGKLGEFFTALAFASAFVSMISLLLAEGQEGIEHKRWERLGLGAFWVHIAGILGIIATLFGLIYTHQYQYHYVWDHSSNELPVYYMISCFWEGQEGSFLLWCFWHSVLGGILIFSKSEFRNLVVAVIASVELILSSMILGIYVSGTFVSGIYLVLALLPTVYFGYQFIRQTQNNQTQYIFQGLALGLGLSSLLLFFRGQNGFWANLGNVSTFGSVDSIAFGFFVLLLIGFSAYYLYYLFSNQQQKFPVWDALAGLGVVGVCILFAGFEADVWKLGSTPFKLLKDVFPDNPVYLTNPEFIPANGGGLNPLLQNYWMVIHPPTLFLGFASTVVPFAFVVAGLIKGKYKEWIRPAMPWTTFSLMILGVGIIMGGYWAYETLNFGGYWNWDPVENSSLVPWLCGVGALHAMLIHQKTKSYLGLSMVMIAMTFLLVLYSTFLTRSGILGDTSVHTFTDLGLSGQLIVLVGLYTLGFVILLASKWKNIPRKEDESAIWTAEFMLFLGVLVFIFAGIEIIGTTSLPVINTILGTNVAPPPQLQLFYYQWNVWFAIAFGILSGLGQFLWWRMNREKPLSDTLFRPFLLALIVSSLCIIGIELMDRDFAFNSIYKDMIDPVLIGGSFVTKILAYVKYGIISIADELMLFASWFAIFANIEVLIAILRKNKKGLKVMGGTVVHIGFGLMLIGMLFSSGYDKVISKNLNPAELASFPEQERIDNIPLERDRSRRIPGFELTYVGKKEAQAPIGAMNIIEENRDAFKLRFKDKTGDVFGIVLPRGVFLAKDSNNNIIQPVSLRTEDLEGQVDLEVVKVFLEERLGVLKPEHINNRTLFGVKMRPLSGEESDSFVLYPEVEINEKMDQFIAHPNRKIYLDRDIYMHVSSAPQEVEEDKYHTFEMKMNEPQALGNINLVVGGINNLTGSTGYEGYDLAVAANLYAITATDTFLTQPVYTIKGQSPGMVGSSINPLSMDFAFVRVDPRTETFTIQVREKASDWVVVKIIEKPLINLLWLGTFILTFGFFISIYRRRQEAIKMS